MLKELEEDRSNVVSVLEKDILPFFKLLSNAIVEPTFNNSYIVDENGDEEPLQTALCRFKDQIFQDVEEMHEFRPMKNSYTNSIEYPLFKYLYSSSNSFKKDSW